MTDDRSDSIVRVEFGIPDTAAVLGGFSGESSRATLMGIVPRGDGQYAVYLRVEGMDPDATLERGCASEDVTLVDSRGDGGLVEAFTTGDAAVPCLAELACFPRQETYAPGTTSVVADVPPYADAPAVIAGFLEEHPDAELVAKSNRASFTPPGRLELRRSIDEALTARQRQVLELAYRRGFFSWPRECTGEELAADLGITPSTFAQHLKVAERKLLSILFVEGLLGTQAGRGATAHGGSSRV